VFDTGGFRFAGVGDLHNSSFLPAAAKYGDLPGLLTLGAGRLYLVGEKERAVQWIRSFSPDREKITSASSSDEAVALSWLMENIH
jgi:hypothetical protein